MLEQVRKFLEKLTSIGVRKVAIEKRIQAGEKREAELEEMILQEQKIQEQLENSQTRDL